MGHAAEGGREWRCVLARNIRNVSEVFRFRTRSGFIRCFMAPFLGKRLDKTLEASVLTVVVPVGVERAPRGRHTERGRLHIRSLHIRS